MSATGPDELSDFFALPPFKADEALVKLRRDLRELKPLMERGGETLRRFEWKGVAVIELVLGNNAAGQSVVLASLAKRPSPRPEWTRSELASSADVRKWTEEVRRALKRWDDDD